MGKKYFVYKVLASHLPTSVFVGVFSLVVPPPLTFTYSQYLGSLDKEKLGGGRKLYSCS